MVYRSRPHRPTEQDTPLLRVESEFESLWGYKQIVPTKHYYDTGSYLWVRGDDQERLITLVPWLNGYNSTLSRCEMRVRIPSGPPKIVH